MANVDEIKYKEELITPKLRFSYYKDAWFINNFHECFTIKTSYPITRENLRYDTGNVKCIHYGDIHNLFPCVLYVKDNIVPTIDSNINLKKISGDNFCNNGDIIFADTSEDLQDVGKVVEVIIGDDDRVLSGLHTIIARPIHKFQIGFLGYLFQTKTIRSLIQKEAQGTKVLSISAGRLKNMSLKYPSLNEQRKIVQLFSTVDKKLQALKKKKRLLEEYKKGIMQKLFSQEVRFKDEIGEEFPEWEAVLGSAVFDSISKKGNIKLPILAVTQEHGAIPRNLIDYEISVTDKSIESYKEVNAGDFIISLRSFQGGIEYSKYTGICSPAYIILRPKIELNDLFFKYYFKSPPYIKLLNSKLEGIRDGKMVSFKYFSEIKLPFPAIREQSLISEFLFSIDCKIRITEKLISNGESWKKGLLQKMFC